jgi:hypothetical protein
MLTTTKPTHKLNQQQTLNEIKITVLIAKPTQKSQNMA